MRILLDECIDRDFESLYFNHSGFVSGFDRSSGLTIDRSNAKPKSERFFNKS